MTQRPYDDYCELGQFHRTEIQGHYDEDVTPFADSRPVVAAEEEYEDNEAFPQVFEGTRPTP